MRTRLFVIVILSFGTISCQVFPSAVKGGVEISSLSETGVWIHDAHLTRFEFSEWLRTIEDKDGIPTSFIINYPATVKDLWKLSLWSQSVAFIPMVIHDSSDFYAICCASAFDYNVFHEEDELCVILGNKKGIEIYSVQPNSSAISPLVINQIDSRNKFKAIQFIVDETFKTSLLCEVLHSLESKIEIPTIYLMPGFQNSETDTIESYFGSEFNAF